MYRDAWLLCSHRCAWRFIVCECENSRVITHTDQQLFFVCRTRNGWQETSRKLFGKDFMWKLHVCWLNQKHGINLALVNSVKVKQRMTNHLPATTVCECVSTKGIWAHATWYISVNTTSEKLLPVNETPNEFYQLNFRFAFNSNLDASFHFEQSLVCFEQLIWPIGGDSIFKLDSLLYLN